MRAVVWMSQPLADLVVRRVAAYEPICVRSAKEFLEAAKPVGTVAFLDAETLALVGELSHVALTAYVITVCSDQFAAAKVGSSRTRGFPASSARACSNTR